MMGIHGFSAEDTQAFQRQLGKFILNIEEEWNEVVVRWESLQECWRDHQYIKFEQEFERLSRQYEQTKKECEDYYVFLNKKIDEVKKVPTLNEYIEVGMEIISAVGSLLGGAPLPSQPNSPPFPATSYVQAAPLKEDTSCSVNKFDPEKEPSVQKFESKPQFMRPMSPENELEEIYQQDEDTKRERRRREMGMPTTENNQPKASGST